MGSFFFSFLFVIRYILITAETASQFIFLLVPDLPVSFFTFVMTYLVFFLAHLALLFHFEPGCRHADILITKLNIEKPPW